jgi:hypothetical protein
MSDASKYAGFVEKRFAFKNDVSKFFHSSRSSLAEALPHLFAAQYRRSCSKPIF